MKQIDNRKPPVMKYQYFDVCQTVEYPQILVKVVGTEAWVEFDGEHVDTFEIKELVEGIVRKNIKTIE